MTLQSLTEERATEAYASWLNDPVVNKYLETRSVTIQDLKDFINEKNASASALLLGVFANDTDKHIGNVKLEPLDYEKGVATIGILIGDKDYWGKGIATEATNLVAGYSFQELGLKELNLGVISGNRAAIRVYEKCGFVVDHVKKKVIDRDGVLYDDIFMRKTSPSG